MSTVTEFQKKTAECRLPLPIVASNKSIMHWFSTAGFVYNELQGSKYASEVEPHSDDNHQPRTRCRSLPCAAKTLSLRVRTRGSHAQLPRACGQACPPTTKGLCDPHLESPAYLINSLISTKRNVHTVCVRKYHISDTRLHRPQINLHLHITPALDPRLACPFHRS